MKPVTWRALYGRASFEETRRQTDTTPRPNAFQRPG